uniref:DHR10 domain-containing protein n=1 Tax=Macrostomum lignano TaxID=282301 RepID=A0A1I8JC57_9PLAT
MLVYRLTGISVSSEDQEQQSPGGYAPTSNQDKQVALLSFALPSLLKAAHVNCPITISDICSQLAPDRTKRLLDVLSGLVNLLVYYQKCTKTQLDKALCAEAAANQRQVAEFESAASQAASLTRQVESTRTKLRSRENELSAEQHAVEELVCRREAQDQEVVGQEAIAKSMRARKAKLAEQAVASPEGLFHLKSKMEEDVEQRKVLLEARYKRLEEVKSQGRAAKSQLRVSELPALFDEADRHRQVGFS